MPLLPLEPTDDRAKPIFRDRASCQQWLSQLQLTNLQLAHSLLLTQLNEFNRFPMRGPERLDTLELLRDTIHYVQYDYARKLIGKPLPLNENELVVFFALVQLWHAMSHGYQRCLQACIAGDRQLAKQAALLCQRALAYSGLAIAEHLRTGYEFDPKLWHQLHGIYAYAEEQGLLLTDVPDPLARYQPTDSCHRSYLRILLTCSARPAQLTRSQLKLLDSWLPQWTAMLGVERSYTASKEDAPPLAFDLASARGLQPVKQVQAGETVRYLAMMPLSKLLRVKTILLQQGKSPEQIELGELGNSHECIELLTFLHLCWCEETTAAQESPPEKLVQLCHTPESIYAHLSGKSFKASVRPSANESAALKQIETLGHALQNAPGQSGGEPAPPLETWLAEAENALGAQLTRTGTAGGRLGNNQLIALRQGETESFVLGATTKVSVTRTGQLHIGVRLLPGTVQAVIVRIKDDGAEPGEKSAAAFLLQASAALSIPASLIIPPNWFRPGRSVEIKHPNGEKQNAKLGFSVQRGADYERVSFTLV